MKIYLANDTSSFHAGSAAVMASLRHTLVQQGHEIIGSSPRPGGCDVELIKRCDAMVLNGEGAIQEETRGMDNFRSERLMLGLILAKAHGAKAYLVNAVWSQMRPVWHDVLQMLDGVWVREISSAEEMQLHQHFEPMICPDLSYSCPLDESAPRQDFQGKAVVGVLYPRNMPKWRKFSHTSWPFHRMPVLGLGGMAEPGRLPSANWSSVVGSLRTAELYVTGQHHGVLAACKARIPFAVMKLHNHKIEGLFRWAGVRIPIAHTRFELIRAIRFARENSDEFKKLFDFLDKCPQWPGIPKKD